MQDSKKTPVNEVKSLSSSARQLTDVVSMPYSSGTGAKKTLGLLHIDIETTGLNKSFNNVIQLAAIYDDMVSPLDQLQTIVLWIKHDTYNIDEYCYNLHKSLLPEVFAKGGKEDAVYNVFAKWLQTLKLDNTFTLCGKNVASFDLPFLQASPWFTEAMKNNGIKFRHRIFDIGTAYTQLTDEVMPDLKLCCLRAGLDSNVQHEALADCWMTVKLARKHFGVQI